MDVPANKTDEEMFLELSWISNIMISAVFFFFFLNNKAVFNPKNIYLQS